MNKQSQKDKRKYKSLKISEILDQITGTNLNKNEKIEFIINYRWNEIVGDFFSQYSEVDRVVVKGGKYSYEDTEYQGIIHVNVVGPATLEFLHFKDKIIQKINSFFGYQTITRISIHQVPYLGKSKKEQKDKKHKKDLNRREYEELKKTTLGIKDKDLEKALLNLGESILKDFRNDEIVK